MDTSKKYIKMCKEAWKDLHREPCRYDMVAFKYRYYEQVIKQGVEFYYDIVMEWMYRDETFKGGYIFIMWKQDELQEMVDSSITTRLTHLLRLFYKFTKAKSPDKRFRNDDYFNSLEQLWLAFVMKEKFHKEWNGEHWIGKSGGQNGRP